MEADGLAFSEFATLMRRAGQDLAEPELREYYDVYRSEVVPLLARLRARSDEELAP